MERLHKKETIGKVIIRTSIQTPNHCQSNGRTLRGEF
ncbi:MAG: hypothetical protein ACI9WL_001511 [Rubritalea sp.]|jgi:hypothetical protein